MRSSRLLTRVVPVVVVLVLAGLQYWNRPAATSVEVPPAASVSSSGVNDALNAAARAQESGVEVDAHGRVIRLLPDDTKGSRHQRFLVRVAGGLTILISHNIDLAQRVPIQLEDSVAVRGEYEWNERGGLIHWTHHDPARRHEPGWIEHRGRRYD